MEIVKFRITRPERLDKLVTEQLKSSQALSRVRVQALIAEGHVTVNGIPGKPAQKLNNGDLVIVQITDAPDHAANANIIAEAIPLDVIYEDTQIAAINKPAGMVVHPAVGYSSGTLVNAILSRWPQVATVGGENRLGIVHRLDKDTSGVILIAKTEPARLALMKQFAERQIHKRYLALVQGIPARKSGEIDAALGRDPADSKRMAVTRHGDPAVTRYKVIETYGIRYALLEAFPQTGRTHQIRVHLAFIGHPIFGDRLYGPDQAEQFSLQRHFLHAESITLNMPTEKTFHAPLSPELQALLEVLRKS